MLFNYANLRAINNRNEHLAAVKSVSSAIIDPLNIFSRDPGCSPLTIVPAWWSAFFFQILNGRQVSLYLYLSMLMSDTHVCHPTTFQIATDLGLSSSTMVFEAMNVLEENGFILRARRTLPHLGSRRNVYQRPSCEYTIMRLVRQKRIDGRLRPLPYSQPVAPEASALLDKGLQELLGPRFVEYESVSDDRKAPALSTILETLLAERAGAPLDALS